MNPSRALHRKALKTLFNNTSKRTLSTTRTYSIERDVSGQPYKAEGQNKESRPDPQALLAPKPQRRDHEIPIPRFSSESKITKPRIIDGRIIEAWIRNDAEKGEAVFVPVSERWLRELCPCEKCRNPETGQRQINVLKNDYEYKIANVKLSNDGETFQITFRDGHETDISSKLITNRRTQYHSSQRIGLVPPKTWDATVAGSPPSVRYAEVADEGLGELLQKLRQFGFCFVEGTPATPEATESLLVSIGPIRNTHYGGFYDFTSDLSSKDTAYTSESLEPHTDNTYFTEPAGLQALHLLSHTDGSGGESSLVDGLGAAEKLFKEDKVAYKTLSNIGVHAHASGNDGISIQPAQPVPVLSHHVQKGHLMQVRWNNADRAGMNVAWDKMDKWYDAAAKFDALISDPQNQYWFQLTPGKLLIFDNWRVLHGRAAFTGKRRMCGGYIPRDDFISKYRMLNMTDEAIRASTVTG